MNSKKVFGLLITGALLIINVNWANAQWNPAGVLFNRYGETIIPSQQTAIRSVGIGDFTNLFPPLAALNIDANRLPQKISGFPGFFLPGELFRTDGPSNGLNAWRLWTGNAPDVPPDGSPSFEKGMIFNYGNNPVVADQTNFSIQASARDMTFFTLPITANTVGTERVRIVGETGFVGIGTPTPKARLEVANGDIAVTAIGSGIILKATNGENFYRVTVDNTGKLITELVTNL